MQSLMLRLIILLSLFLFTTNVLTQSHDSLTVDQILTGFTEFDIREGHEDGQTHWIGNTSKKSESIHLIGERNNITEARISLTMSDDESVNQRNRKYLFQFIRNCFPEWQESDTWLNDVLNNIKITKLKSKYLNGKQIEIEWVSFIRTWTIRITV